MAPHGKARELWERTVEPLNSLPEFRAQLDWDSARTKYHTMLKDFRREDQRRKSISGGDNEPLGERESLLLNLVELEDAFTSTDSANKTAAAVKGLLTNRCSCSI